MNGGGHETSAVMFFTTGAGEAVAHQVYLGHAFRIASCYPDLAVPVRSDGLRGFAVDGICAYRHPTLTARQQAIASAPTDRVVLASGHYQLLMLYSPL